MTDKINEKVIDIFNNRNKPHASDTEPKVKEYLGIKYVRLDEDANGHPFKKEKLLEYAENCSYIVRVLKKKDDKYSLYNYHVPNSRIIKFINLFANNELSGVIIEIDKCASNELA